MAKWIITAILLLPLAEIVAFIVVAAVVGLVWAVLLMVATTLAGVAVLRRAGRGRIARFRVAVADTDVAGIEANTGGFLTVLAGLLLFLPGFLTDLVGAALLIGPVRRWCGRSFRLWMRRGNSGDRSTIDLAPGEWQQLPDRDLSSDQRKRD
ncbi:MAG: protein FxsA [Alphaproteobacteria bacterium]|jgi:UPF0716 protein FxsA|nr:protein FxsA [Alphaproteobacteria bacterium]